MEVVGSSCYLCEEGFAIYRINQYTYRRYNKCGAASFLKNNYKEVLDGSSSNVSPGKEGGNLLLEI